MPVQFIDNSIQVKAELNDATIAWLYEAAGEIESAAKRNSRVASSDTKNSWEYKVDEAEGRATIGNPLENAIWEEFGTGEYALNKDGRKGYWVFVKGSKKRSDDPKTYTLEEAKRVVAIMRSKGLDAYYTKGKKPSRALFNAFAKNEAKVKRRLESILKEGMQ